MSYLNNEGLERLVSKLKWYTDNTIDNISVSLFNEIEALKESVDALSGDTVKWITNDDYLIALVDCEDSLLFGLTKDAKVYIPEGVPDGVVGLKELFDKYALQSDIPTLSSLGGVGSISASGTSPLTLSASKSGTSVTISGNVANATASTAGVVKPYSVLNTNPSVNSATATSGRYYPVLTTSENALVVNVPWEKGDSSTSSGIDEITASGTSPLTLTATLNGSMVNISGSVDLSSYLTTSSASSTYQTKLNYYTEDTSSKSVDVGVGSTSSIILHTTETGKVTIGTAYCNGDMEIAKRPYIDGIDSSGYKNDNNVAVLGDLNDYAKTSDLNSYLKTSTASSTYQEKLNYITEDTSSKLLNLGDNGAANTIRIICDKTVTIGTASVLYPITFSGDTAEFETKYTPTVNGVDIATVNDIPTSSRVFTSTNLDMFKDAGPATSELYPEASSLAKGDVIIGHENTTNGKVAIGVMETSSTWHARFLQVREIQEEQMWLAINGYIADPSIPRDKLLPSTGTPAVDDIVFGANNLGSFCVSQIIGTDTNGYYRINTLS